MSENAEQVEVEWASAIRGRQRGDREVLVRGADLENLLAQRHVRVVRTIPGRAADPIEPAEAEAVPDPEPEPAKRRGRKGPEDDGAEGD